MDKVIVIEGQTELDGIIDGQVNIDTQIDGEFGTFFEITPPPAPVEDLVIKDVMFMDYDGSVVASYDAADFIANVTALPTPPSHDGLTFQEWNWDLADIKTELQTGSGACCIGAHYTTNDGKSHFYIDLKQEDGYDTVNMYISRDSGTITVEWGDGTSNSYAASVSATHTYENYGEYEIKVAGKWTIVNSQMFLRPKRNGATSGVWYSVSNYFLKRIELGADTKITTAFADSFSRCPNLETVCTHKDIFGTTAPTDFRFANSFLACGSLKFFVFPKILSNVSTTTQSQNPLSGAFTGCASLITVSFPKNFYWIASTFNISGIRFLYFPYIPTLTIKGSTYITFQYCPNLRRVVMKFDAGSTTYSNGLMYNAFGNCYNLEEVTLEQMAVGTPNRYLCSTTPNLTGKNGTITLNSSVTALTGEAFLNCMGVRKYVFFGNITSIGSQSFYANYACVEWDFTHNTQVPTLANTNAFTGIVPEAKIKVPAALESSWKTAANWSTYASYIVGV